MTRNKKIFLITTIAIVGMCLVWFLNSGMNKISGDIFQAYADPDLYKNALAIANNNSEVKSIDLKSGLIDIRVKPSAANHSEIKKRIIELNYEVEDV